MGANRYWTKQWGRRAISQHACDQILRHIPPAILKNHIGQNNCIIEQIILCQTATRKPLLTLPESLLPSIPLGNFNIIIYIKLQLAYVTTKQVSRLIRIYGLQPVSSKEKMKNLLLTKVSVFTGAEPATGQIL